MVRLLHILAALYLGYVSALPLRSFYNYGVDQGDKELKRVDDISSNEIQLRTPIFFYDGMYTSVFVNSNGHLSFESELPNYSPTMVMPVALEFQLIAIYMSDIDLNLGGDVLYRETTDPVLLQKAAEGVRAHFSQFPDFSPLSILIVTWDQVVPYDGDRSMTNTFQIVIASDELNSFVIYNYLDDGLLWTNSKGKYAASGSPDPPAQAGFDSGNGQLHYKLPGSGTRDVTRLARDTNINQPGVWMYHVGNTKGDNVIGPDLNTGDVIIFEPEIDQQTCREGSRQCHASAICEDYQTGFCCRCSPPTYGNGIFCINPDNPQRLNGKVSGVLNGISFDNLDMHGFVQTKEGRAYTAINRVPDSISSALMTLNTIGGLIGWLFAKRGGPGAKNGYMYTGGNLNRTAIITYQLGGEVTITQRYFGQSVQDNIRMETIINGTVPEINADRRITVDDYSEEYRRVGPGNIRSHSKRTFRANDVANMYTWDQVITYDECQYGPIDPNDRNTMKLAVSRNFVVYESNVVRFAMSNTINAMTGLDPCLSSNVNCSEDAYCIPAGSTYSCECKTGFYGDGYSCEDIDECSIDFVNTCDVNAVCYNAIGSFQCQCNFGYRGDGRTCTREATLCGNSMCDDNARCVFNDIEGKPMCECNAGFVGDGMSCAATTGQCNEVDICHENAECVYNPLTMSYNCECPDGFSGDGLYCESHRVISDCDCDPYAYCETVGPSVQRCVCRPGYTGNGYTCSRINEVLDGCDECHYYAECFYDDRAQTNRCRCRRGYQGNGTYCEPSDCREVALCDRNAECRPDSAGAYVCVCRAGFRGDGRRCEAEGCNVLNDCDANAQCVADPRDTSRYLCRCNPGYSGDGKVCIRRVVPCNEVNNCSPDGQCVYDPSTYDYRCRCNRGYEGDGINCRPKGLNCRENPNICDTNAECLLSGDTFMCVCNLGYRGDGQRCDLVQTPDKSYLLFSRGYSIHKIPYKKNGGSLEDGTRVLYVPDELAVGVEVDCAEQKFYWTDVYNGRISNADLDGFEKNVVTTGFKSPEGIAIDWVSRTMYVTDSGLDVVAVMNMNGTYRKTLISGDMRDPRGIAVDPQRGVMFWTDWYRDAPAIERSNMDGTERNIFVDTGLGLPNGLTLDTLSQLLCWGDAGVRKIECIRTDGVGRRVVTEKAQYPFDVSLYGNDIYYSDWTMRAVPSVNVNSGEMNEEPLELPLGGNGRVYGLTSVGEYCPRVNNACYRNNGGCRYMCIPTPNGGRTCACPDELDDETCAQMGTLNKRK